MISFLFVGPFLADLINREIVVPWTVEILSGVEPDMQITRIRLSDKTSRLRPLHEVNLCKQGASTRWPAAYLIL